VLDQWNGRYPFVAHNREVLEAVEALEQRFRRLNVFVLMLAAYGMAMMMSAVFSRLGPFSASTVAWVSWPEALMPCSAM